MVSVFGIGSLSKMHHFNPRYFQQQNLKKQITVNPVFSIIRNKDIIFQHNESVERDDIVNLFFSKLQGVSFRHRISLKEASLYQRYFQHGIFKKRELTIH